MSGEQMSAEHRATEQMGTEQMGTEHMSSALRHLVLVSVGFAVAYGVANELTSLRGDVGDGVFAWEHGIPFWPWTIVPYLSICGFFVLSFFVGSDRAELQRHAARLLLALGIAIVCYAAWPLRFTFERPATHGMTGLLFRALSTFDLPYNRAPSMHICVLLLLWVRLLPHTGGWWRVGLHAWFVLIGLSVLTTYQHHVIDVPAGAAVATLSLAITSRRRWGPGGWPITTVLTRWPARPTRSQRPG